MDTTATVSLPILGATLALVAGLLGGSYFERRLIRKAAALPTPKNKALPPEEYATQRKDYIELYRKSMGEYDRLVPWGSGGALVLSIMVMDTIVQNPEGGTMLFWAFGWGALLIALASSTFSHYTSSRIFSSRRAVLDIVQESTPDNRKEELLRNEWVVDAAGRWTRILNITAGAGLVLGIGALGLFAFLNF